MCTLIKQLETRYIFSPLPFSSALLQFNNAFNALIQIAQLPDFLAFTMAGRNLLADAPDYSS